MSNVIEAALRLIQGLPPKVVTLDVGLNVADAIVSELNVSSD
jgi:hypothetical protein